MPTKKGKSKPSKAKKSSNKLRRTKTAGSANTSKRAGAARKTGATARGGKKRATGKLKRTEAGSVWIGSSPAPVARPTEERGDHKAGDSGSVRIL